MYFIYYITDNSKVNYTVLCFFLISVFKIFGKLLRDWLFFLLLELRIFNFNPDFNISVIF